jgi:uncharacterized protein (TIGR02246 family)
MHDSNHRGQGPRTPADLIACFGQYLRDGALDRLLELYEQEAVFAPEPGVVHTGRVAVRAALAGMLELSPAMTANVIEVQQAGDIALVIVDWKLRGTAPDGTPIEKQGRSADVLRRQSDGTWRVLIDHP